MKKLFNLLFVFILLISMTSCKKEVFSLEDKYYGNEDLIELESLEAFEKLVDDKESFAIFIYLPGCSTCAAFRPIVKQFLGSNEMTFYTISMTLLKEKENAITNKTKFAPSVLLFNKGKVIAYLDTKKDDHVPYYKTVEGFTEWFTKYCEIKIYD